MAWTASVICPLERFDNLISAEKLFAASKSRLSSTAAMAGVRPFTRLTCRRKHSFMFRAKTPGGSNVCNAERAFSTSDGLTLSSTAIDERFSLKYPVSSTKSTIYRAILRIVWPICVNISCSRRCSLRPCSSPKSFSRDMKSIFPISKAVPIGSFIAGRKCIAPCLNKCLFDIPALASTVGRVWLGGVCILGNISLFGLELAIFSNWRWVAGTEEMCEPSALGISNSSRGFCADSCSINSFSSILLS